MERIDLDEIKKIVDEFAFIKKWKEFVENSTKKDESEYSFQYYKAYHLNDKFLSDNKKYTQEHLKRILVNNDEEYFSNEENSKYACWCEIKNETYSYANVLSKKTGMGYYDCVNTIVKVYQSRLFELKKQGFLNCKTNSV